VSSPKKTFSGVVAYEINTDKSPNNRRMLTMNATFELKDGKVLCSVQVASMPKANMETKSDQLPTEDEMKNVVKASAQAIVEVFYEDKGMRISNIKITFI
jgi:hypothetical protein